MKMSTWFFAALSLMPIVISFAHTEASGSFNPRAGEPEERGSLAGTWTVRNETADSIYSGATAIGQVTFVDEHLTIDSGGLAAAGLVAASAESFCFTPSDPISFKFVGPVMYVAWVGQARGTDFSLPQDAVITFVKLGRNRITMVGAGGCGNSTPRISYLERLR